MSDGGEKKIIIDEDWKTQAQAEKEKLQQQTKERPETAEPSPEQGFGPLPAPSLPVLLSMLASQAMISLGQIPNPMTGKPEVRGDEAKHFIDLIGILEEKTKGNLSSDEDAMLSNLLSELRMAYVTIVSGGPAPTPPASDAS